MPYRIVILFLTLLIFALSANNLWACGNDDSAHAAKFHQESPKKSCCSTSETHTTGGNDLQHEHSGPDCPCDHENNDCHCPGCGLICHFNAAFAPAAALIPAPLICDASLQRQAFYFADQLPEAVYASIWQPPKLAAR